MGEAAWCGWVGSNGGAAVRALKPERETRERKAERTVTLSTWYGFASYAPAVTLQGCTRSSSVNTFTVFLRAALKEGRARAELTPSLASPGHRAHAEPG